MLQSILQSSSSFRRQQHQLFAFLTSSPSSIGKTLTLTLGAGLLAVFGLHIVTEVFVRCRSYFFESRQKRPLCFPLSSSSSMTSMKISSGPKIIITGGTQGIGLELVKKFLRLGYQDIEIWDLPKSPERLEQFHQEINSTSSSCDNNNNNNNNNVVMNVLSSSSVKLKEVDVGSLEQVTKACQDFLDRNNGCGPDVLVLNAGMVAKKKLGNFHPPGLIQKCFNVNASVHILELLNIMLPKMLYDNRSHHHHHQSDNDELVTSSSSSSSNWRRSIILMSSITAFSGFAAASEYCSTKAAVVSMGDSIRSEIRVAQEDHRTRNNNSYPSPPHDIDVLTVCPYLVRTKMFDDCLEKPPFWFFSALDPKWVAEKIVDDGMRFRREVLILPMFFYLMPVVKSVVPSWVWRIADDLLQASRWFSG